MKRYLLGLALLALLLLPPQHAEAASRFWVGGTGTWDASDTTHWAATSGGAGGQSVPGTGDTVTFDANSGGGTVTLNFGGTITIQSLATGAFTGTWDNSVNNNNVTFTASAGWTNNGSGTRTLKLGSATYTIQSGTGDWTFGTTTNLTFLGSTSAIVMGGSTSTQKTFSGGGLTYGTVTFGASSGSGYFTVTGSNTIGTLNVTGPNRVLFTNSTTQTVSTTNLNGTSSGQILIESVNITVTAAFAVTTFTGAWTAFRAMAFTGSPTATNSFNLGNNSGITINAPASGTGGGIIGG